MILIVKGTKEVAIEAAAKHDIKISEDIEETSKGDQMLWATDYDMADIQAWYGELPTHAPFPDGTLLFYNPAK